MVFEGNYSEYENDKKKRLGMPRQGDGKDILLSYPEYEKVEGRAGRRVCKLDSKKKTRLSPTFFLFLLLSPSRCQIYRTEAHQIPKN